MEGTASPTVARSPSWWSWIDRAGEEEVRAALACVTEMPLGLDGEVEANRAR